MKNDRGGGRRGLGGEASGQEMCSERNWTKCWGADRREVVINYYLQLLLACSLFRCNEKARNEGEQGASRWADLSDVPNLAH